MGYHFELLFALEGGFKRCEKESQVTPLVPYPFDRMVLIGQQTAQASLLRTSTSTFLEGTRRPSKKVKTKQVLRTLEHLLRTPKHLLRTPKRLLRTLQKHLLRTLRRTFLEPLHAPSEYPLKERPLPFPVEIH